LDQSTLFDFDRFVFDRSRDGFWFLSRRSPGERPTYYPGSDILIRWSLFHHPALVLGRGVVKLVIEVRKTFVR
jgi:hypothetical protein